MCPLPDPVGASFDNADIALFASLTLAQPATQAPAAFGGSRDVAPLVSTAGADWGQQPSAAPDAGLSNRGSGGSSFNVAPVAANAPPDAATLALMLGAGLGTSGQPAQAAAAGTLAAGTGGNGDSSGSGGPLVNSHHHGRPDNKHGDPLWVLDANNYIVLSDGGTGHDFAGWNADLYAQVSGATVQTSPPGYSWTYSATDVNQSTVTGQGTYHPHFQWNDFSDTNLVRSDTISLQTTNTDQSHEAWSFTFEVFAHNTNPVNPFWSANSTRPTTIPSFPLLVPPDAVKPGQEMIRQPYYSLIEETGEVQTSFTLPTYNPGIPPLQLDYSSLAANPLPIFTEYYQLGNSVPNTLTASLYWNCSNGCTGQMPVASTSYDTRGQQNPADMLNPGDIMDIALQYAPSSPLSTGRYPYEIHVNDGGNLVVKAGFVDIVSESMSAFGAGWSLDNVYQIIPVSGGVILALPYGESLWFASSGPSSFTTPPSDFSSLQLVGGVPLILHDGREG